MFIIPPSDCSRFFDPIYDVYLTLRLIENVSNQVWRLSLLSHAFCIGVTWSSSGFQTGNSNRPLMCFSSDYFPISCHRDLPQTLMSVVPLSHFLPAFMMRQNGFRSRDVNPFTARESTCATQRRTAPHTPFVRY